MDFGGVFGVAGGEVAGGCFGGFAGAAATVRGGSGAFCTGGGSAFFGGGSAVVAAGGGSTFAATVEGGVAVAVVAAGGMSSFGGGGGMSFSFAVAVVAAGVAVVFVGSSGESANFRNRPRPAAIATPTTPKMSPLFDFLIGVNSSESSALDLNGSAAGAARTTFLVTGFADTGPCDAGACEPGGVETGALAVPWFIGCVVDSDFAGETSIMFCESSASELGSGARTGDPIPMTVCGESIF